LQGLKELFNISNDNLQTPDAVLLVQVTDTSYSYALTNHPSTVLYQLKYYSISSPEELIQQTLPSAALPGGANMTYIVVSTGNCSITPVLRTPQGALAIVQSQQAFAHDIELEQVTGWQNNSVFYLPPRLRDLLKQSFPAARILHRSQVDLMLMNQAGNEGMLIADIGPDQFRLVAGKDRALLFAGNFSYSTPVDVLYYLLQACENFSFSQDQVQLMLSGLFDRESALMNELQQYFLNLACRNASWSANELPLHYFTSLNDIAVCAS
jgi:hypothetical protein